MTDLSELTLILENVHYGDLGVGAIVLPEWQHDDPRWEAARIASDHHTRMQVIDQLGRDLERKYVEKLRTLVSDGLTRPQLASALGLSLHEALHLLGEA